MVVYRIFDQVIRSLNNPLVQRISPSEAHADLDLDLYLLPAEVQQVIVELDRSLLERDDNGRAAKLKVTDLGPLFNSRAHCLKLFMYSI